MDHEVNAEVWTSVWSIISFINTKMFKTRGARGLNLNVTYCVLARQPENNGRKGIENDPCGSKVIIYDQCAFGQLTDAPVLV